MSKMMWKKVNILVIPCAIFLFINGTVNIDAKPLDIYDEIMESNDNLLYHMAEFMNSIGAVDSIEDSGRLAPINSADDRVADDTKQMRAVDRCMLPVRRGVCRALIPRWNYDPSTKTCKEFKFGGCDGNGNNFTTHKQCMEMCDDL